jgi:hypothetical protein
MSQEDLQTYSENSSIYCAGTLFMSGMNPIEPSSYEIVGTSISEGWSRRLSLTRSVTIQKDKSKKYVYGWTMSSLRECHTPATTLLGRSRTLEAGFTMPGLS